MQIQKAFYLNIARLEAIKLSRISRFSSFIICGLLSVVAGLGTLWLFTSVIHIHYAISNIFSFIASTIVWYYLNKCFTFRDALEQKHSFVKSVGVRLFGLASNEGILLFLTAICHVNYLISSCISTILIFPITYALSVLLIWNTRIVWGSGN